MPSTLRYALIRLSLVPVTLIAIFTVNFAVIMLMPGGPVDQILSRQLIGSDAGSLAERSIQFGASADAGVAGPDTVPSSAAGNEDYQSLEARRVEDIR